MVKHTQKIHQQIADKLFECVELFDHFVGLALKGLTLTFISEWKLKCSTIVYINKLHA